MTLSKTERSENIELVLKLMMGELDERGINQLWFEIDKPPYENIYPTTWHELANRHLIERHDTWGARKCGLTGNGWLEGLKITGTLEAPEMKGKVGKIMAEIKKPLGGRGKKAIEDTESIAARAGVPRGFVFNIIESRYIETILNRKGAGWCSGARGDIIEIPVDFGLEIL